MAVPALSPIMFTAFIGWAYYRRIRNSFGRQPWRPTRTGIRLGLLGLALVAMTMAAVFVPHAALPVAGGLALGATLGAFAIRHTQMGWFEGKRCYTPNPWIGAALSLLLVGRLLWRAGSGVFGAGAQQMTQNASPLTLAIGSTLIAYYIVQGIGLSLAMRRLAREACAPAAPGA
jgi:hypothetical protein